MVIRRPNILIVIFSPRDIPIFKEHIDNVNSVDKLWVKYYNAADAYKITRDFFLSHTEYDYLALLPDDLLIIQYDIDILRDGIERFRYPVICGWCNLDQRYPYFTNICLENVPSEKREGREYRWLRTDSPILTINNLVQVMFAGFPLMVIRRDIVEKIPFRSDIADGTGCCYDVMFCRDCYVLGVPIMMDPRAKLEHLKTGVWEGEHELLFGKKEPYTFLERAR